MKKSTSAALPTRPLSLRLRHLRQLHSTASLGQAQLAALAGVSARQLRAFEATRTIPTSLRLWLALAAALRCSVEDLVAPHELGHLRSKTTGEPAPALVPPVVAVVRRARAAVAVCLSENAILEVRGFRRGQLNGDALDRISEETVRLALDYGADRIVTDDDSRLSLPVADLPIQVVPMTLQLVAKALNLGRCTRQALSVAVLERLPEISRFLRRSVRTGMLDPFDRRSPTTLLASAFALAMSTTAATTTSPTASLSSPPTVCTTTP